MGVKLFDCFIYMSELGTPEELKEEIARKPKQGEGCLIGDQPETNSGPNN